VTLGIELAIEIGGAGDEAVIGRTAQHSFRNGGGALARKVAANDGSTAAVPDEHDLFPALHRVKARDAFSRAVELQPDSVDAIAGLTVLDVGTKNESIALARLEKQLAG
jgi:hypothetical protein